MGRNRLADATSPYLLQHADNPVHWWEWGPDPFAEALRRDVPVLLSVGYASCHWCHVMAHESFEDPVTAEEMNAAFVNVKVDREERPDVDRIYMDAVQAMTRRGGWPMTVFLTPDGEPFYAGTYFPSTDRHGMPSFRRVLAAVADAWANRREEITRQAGALAASLATPITAAARLPDEATLAAAHDTLWREYDRSHGGFGGAPKFPQAPTLEFLLRAAGHDWAPHAEEMLAGTLRAIDRGGIHDHVGGGFSRYSTDERWLVPHFEKMLYDNALLARLYTRAWQVAGDDRFAEVARTTFDYLLRDLALPAGGFASGEDADSEGHEGRFYVFDEQEIDDAAGDDAALVRRAWGVEPGGNFEGASIVHLAVPVARVAEEFEVDPGAVTRALDRTAARLAEIRGGRVRPGLDDKAVSAWNGLALRALAEGSWVLGEPRLLEAARSLARFLLDGMRRPDGRLLRARRDGRGEVPAFADDHGAVALGLLALYEATGDAVWFTEASRVVHDLVDLFWDDEQGGVFATGSDAERLVARPKNLFDNPTPSDNALAAEAMQHLAALTGDPAWTERVEAILRLGLPVMERWPGGAGQLLAVALVHLTPPHEVAIVGPDRDDLVSVVHRVFRPAVFLASGEGTEPIPLLADRPAVDGMATAYVCRGFVCDAPVTAPEALAALLP